MIMILKMNFNFNFKDSPGPPTQSIRGLTTAGDLNCAVEMPVRTAPGCSEELLSLDERCVDRGRL